ncbi:hypothetical protein [Singulisphaera sp. PoT]|uniref:hypothetical protein n=1 Tax=Singulisphaera sp. PoT TaxID=3411797 RepID=UPI003BF5D2AB
MTLSSMIVGMLLCGSLMLLAGWMTDALRVSSRPHAWEPGPREPIAYHDYFHEARASR